MDGAVVGKETFFARVIVVCAVVDAGLFAGCAAEHLGLPRVEMGIEVDHGDGAVGSVDGSEQG